MVGRRGTTTQSSNGCRLDAAIPGLEGMGSILGKIDSGDYWSENTVMDNGRLYVQGMLCVPEAL